jgi:hypothetical protein
MYANGRFWEAKRWGDGLEEGGKGKKACFGKISICERFSGSD